MLVVFLSGAFLYLLSYRYFWKVDSKEKEQGPGYEMVSHRGVTVDAPENTIEAFLDAKEIATPCSSLPQINATSLFVSLLYLAKISAGI